MALSRGVDVLHDPVFNKVGSTCWTIRAEVKRFTRTKAVPADSVDDRRGRLCVQKRGPTIARMVARVRLLPLLAALPAPSYLHLGACPGTRFAGHGTPVGGARAPGPAGSAAAAGADDGAAESARPGPLLARPGLDRPLAGGCRGGAGAGEGLTSFTLCAGAGKD